MSKTYLRWIDPQMFKKEIDGIKGDKTFLIKEAITLEEKIFAYSETQHGNLGYPLEQYKINLKYISDLIAEKELLETDTKILIEE